MKKIIHAILRHYYAASALRGLLASGHYTAQYTSREVLKEKDIHSLNIASKSTPIALGWHYHNHKTNKNCRFIWCVDEAVSIADCMLIEMTKKKPIAKSEGKEGA